MGFLVYDPNRDDERLPVTAYAASNPARPATHQLAGEIRADVAIIGGGFVGVAAALQSATSGARVALLEAKAIGWGSAGRAAGQVSAHATKLEPQDVLKIYGPVYGERLNAAGAAAPEMVQRLAGEHGFDIDAMAGGIVSVAHTPKALARFRARAEFWQARGAAVEYLDRRQVAELIGCAGYLGGVIDRRGIVINPLALIRGLARAAAEAGAALFEHSRATRLRRDGTGWRIEAERGHVVADAVLLCTNAYTDDLWPGLRRTVIPVRSYQLWTEPLDAADAATILPGAVAFNDSQKLIKGGRRLPGGRLQFSGGRPGFGPESRPDLAREAARIRRLFPQLRSLALAGWWSGWVTRGISDGWRLHALAPGVWTAIACNGRGIAMGPIFGRELARVAGGTPASDLLVPITPAKPIVGYRVHRPFAECATRYFSWRDRREIARNAVASS